MNERNLPVVRVAPRYVLVPPEQVPLPIELYY